MAIKDSSKNKQLNNLLKNKIILVTGGAGSVGTELVKHLLKYPVKTVRVFDINEHSLFKLKRSLSDKRLRLLLGSITDKDRLEMAGEDVDIIIHTAAVKNIEITEFNALDTIDVNVNGTMNMIKMALKIKPELFLNISTDKAADATTLYGNTKQLGERLITWAGIHIHSSKFGSVRFGNVIESRGNVFEIWAEEANNNKPLSITDPTMSRYFFHVDEAVSFILISLLKINRGEVIVPKMRLHNIKDLSMKFSKHHKIIGKRPGEKNDEILITQSELKKAKEYKNMWIIIP